MHSYNNYFTIFACQCISCTIFPSTPQSMDDMTNMRGRVPPEPLPKHAALTGMLLVSLLGVCSPNFLKLQLLKAKFLSNLVPVSDL